MIDTHHLRALMEKATAGTWTLCPHLKPGCTCTCGYYGDIGAGDTTVALMGRCHADGADDTGCGCHMTKIAKTQDERAANGQLIVAAVNSLPELLDEVERLRAQLATARAMALEEAAKVAEHGAREEQGFIDDVQIAIAANIRALIAKHTEETK